MLGGHDSEQLRGLLVEATALQADRHLQLDLVQIEQADRLSRPHQRCHVPHELRFGDLVADEQEAKAHYCRPHWVLYVLCHLRSSNV